MNINHIRKLASIERGKRYMEERFGPRPVDAVAHTHLLKAAQAEDRGLLMIASRLPGPTLETYEALGGTFKKEAIGVPMFNVGGSPPIMPSLRSPMQQSAMQPQVQPQRPTATGGPTTGGGVPQIKEPKIPGQQPQGMAQGMPKTSSLKPKAKKEKHSGISATDISMMQQAFPVPGQQPQQQGQQGQQALQRYISGQ
jgi:hypothetical protein